jgi:hypothetical protein
VRTRRWARSALARAATGELTGDARRYARLRLTDELAARRGRHRLPFRAHAHVALDPDLHDPAIAARLHEAVEELVRDAGLDGWITTMDVPHRRAAPVARDVTVVGRSPNRTATWLLGRPVDRVTLAVPVRERRR